MDGAVWVDQANDGGNGRKLELPHNKPFGDWAPIPSCAPWRNRPNNHQLMRTLCINSGECFPRDMPELHSGVGPIIVRRKLKTNQVVARQAWFIQDVSRDAPMSASKGGHRVHLHNDAKRDASRVKHVYKSLNIAHIPG